MKTIIVISSLLLSCVSAQSANSTTTTSSTTTQTPPGGNLLVIRQTVCIFRVLLKIEREYRESGGLGRDVLETFRRLREQRERCEAMLISDPPSAAQQRLRQ